MYGLCSLTDHHLAEDWFVVSLTSHVRKTIVIEITRETGHWRKLLYLPLYLQQRHCKLKNETSVMLSLSQQVNNLTADTTDTGNLDFRGSYSYSSVLCTGSLYVKDQDYLQKGNVTYHQVPAEGLLDFFQREMFGSYKLIDRQHTCINVHGQVSPKIEAAVYASYF